MCRPATRCVVIEIALGGSLEEKYYLALLAQFGSVRTTVFKTPLPSVHLCILSFSLLTPYVLVAMGYKKNSTCAQNWFDVVVLTVPSNVQGVLHDKWRR